jgi:hypothetical protein
MAYEPWQSPALETPTRPPIATASRRFGVIAALALAVSAVIGGPAAAPGSVAAASAATTAGCTTSFQSLVNSAPSGGTITLSPCTFHQTVTIAKRLTVHANGAVIDGDNTRSAGLVVTASDVAIDGLTVTHVRGGDHRGAVYVTGVSRFTLQNSVARDSSPACLSLNGGTGHRILNSELTGCAQEGYFINRVSSSTLSGNHIHHNNMNFAYNWEVEAGGGKTMASRAVTFDHNEVDNNHGPGIWFDEHDVDVVVTANRIHDNDREGVFFEISSGANIGSNSVWRNGWGFVAWGYGAGITISSSDRANVHDNTVAWNARQISVISQNRNSPPHVNNVVHDNTMLSARANKVAGWYDDHGGSLFSSANGNHGYGDRFWVGAAEPTSGRFEWNGGRSTLSAYNATNGETNGVNISAAARDAALSAAGIPADSGPPIAGPPRPGTPHLGFRAGQLGSSSIPGRISWLGVSGATGYQLQVQHDGGAWSTVHLSSSRSRSFLLSFTAGHVYRARVRARFASGIYSGWSYSSLNRAIRVQENNGSAQYSSGWTRTSLSGASGGFVRYKTAAGAVAKFTFTGRAFAWVAPRGPSRGTARIKVDGTEVATFSLYRSTTLARYMAWSNVWASSGAHTIEIVVVGTPRHPRIDVDAFTVLR